MKPINDTSLKEWRGGSPKGWSELGRGDTKNDEKRPRGGKGRMGK